MTVLLGWTQPVLGPAKVLFDIKRVQSPFSTRSGLAFLAQDWDREQWPIPEGYWMSQICGSIVQCVPYSGMSRQMNPTRLTTGSSFRVVSLNQMINKWLALNAQSTMTFISVWSIKIKRVLLTTGKRSHAQHENYLSKLNISPTPAGRWNTTLNTVCSPPAGNKDLGLEYILLTKGQWVGGLQIELSLSTFSLPRWHVTYHREESRQSYLSQHFLLTTVTCYLPLGGVGGGGGGGAADRVISLNIFSPYHDDTSLTTVGRADRAISLNTFS